MEALIYYHGNKNYSSWSMRGWLALRLSGLEFEERMFDLSAEGIRTQIGRHSPSRKVPALGHGERTIWDSLAIFEYLAELRPDRHLWPMDAGARAVARAVSAEMHSGFLDLRREMPFNVRRKSPGKGRTPAVMADIERILAIWCDCRDRFGADGPFLFGAYGLADCMYAPVVSRLLTYDVAVEGHLARGYVDAVWKHPDVAAWRSAAEAEPIVESRFDL